MQTQLNRSKNMEGKPPDNNNILSKGTFKDIFINANNDDVIIPISTTFDKAVLHIGIGNRSGVSLEKPNGKDMNTSVRYATRRFIKDRYNGRNNKDRGVSDCEREYEKPKLDIDQKLYNDLQNEKDIARELFEIDSSQVSFEIKKVTETLSEYKIRRPAKSNKDGNDHIKTTMVTHSSPDIRDVSKPESRQKHNTTVIPTVCTEVDSPVIDKINENTDTVKDKLTKTIFEALVAKSSLKQACDAIDKAYENEMSAIAIENEAAVCKPNEKWPQNKIETCPTIANDTYQGEVLITSNRGSQRFSEHAPSKASEKRVSFSDDALKNQTATGSDTCENTEHDAKTVKPESPFPTEKYVIIAKENECGLNDMAKNDQVYISEVVTFETDDNGSSHNDGTDKAYIVCDQSKSGTSKSLDSNVALCESIIHQDDIKRSQNCKTADATMYRQSFDTELNIDLPDANVTCTESKIDSPDAIDEPRSLNTELKSDPSDAILDNYEPPDNIVDSQSLGTESNSDSSDTIYETRSHNTESKSEQSGITVDNRSLDAASHSALSYTILDNGSLHANAYSEQSVAIDDEGSEGELSDSDTLENIDDIDDFDTKDVDEESDEAAAARNDTYVTVNEDDDIDTEDDVLDIGDIALIDRENEDAARNDAADTVNEDDATNGDDATDGDDVTSDVGVTDDDNSLFGIMNIYRESVLHYDIDKMTTAEHCAENKDFGYKFFSFSTFFI